ncbi:MAG: hypothetical protein JO182_26710 [Acidobacteriaceae bacterium]|nr:hypothetical protein [Acidobacteriaceae bacterium]MBV9938178.1 hypothetical protein [Acidobacteriaceae bacterium]
MRIRIGRYFGFYLLTFALFSVPLKLYGANLIPLSGGRHVHLVMLGQGPLCDAKVQDRSPELVTIRLEKTTPECGSKGETLRITKEQVVDVAPTERLTRGRFAAKFFLGLGSIAALCAIPLNSSDPESWLIVTNLVVPGFVAYGASQAIPKRHDYLIFLTCPDRLHCFSDANRLTVRP